MKKLIVTGGNRLQGIVAPSGAKNVVLKALVAATLTSEPVTIKNIPLISDFALMVEILEELGAQVHIVDHEITIIMKDFLTSSISLDKAAQVRTSALFIAPLLARLGEAIIPNPGGCRLGIRPIDRTIAGLEQLHCSVTYHSEDGYFHAKTTGLKATTYTFEKNTHTGTETLLLAAVMAKGTSVLNNAAQEPEVDELINLLNAMGGNVKRTGERQITIHGVTSLHGCTFEVQPDRNEIVTFAIAAFITKGDIMVKNAGLVDLEAFYHEVDKIGGGYEKQGNDVRFFYIKPLQGSDVSTRIYPGFMTDWQAPWAVLMTQAQGVSTIHETVFEYRFGYVKELKKMGAHISFFNPPIENPETFYNFNLTDDKPDYHRAIRIEGQTPLHNAVVEVSDLRAGATLVLAALAAKGKSTIFNSETLERGYEKFDERLQAIGADIRKGRT